MTANVARRERDRLTGINTDLGITVNDAVDDYRRLVTDKLKSGYRCEVYLRHLCDEFGTRKLAVEMGYLDMSPLQGVFRRITGYESNHRDRGAD
jgi:hypothetical protein